MYLCQLAACELFSETKSIDARSILKSTFFKQLFIACHLHKRFNSLQRPQFIHPNLTLNEYYKKMHHHPTSLMLD